MFIETVLISRKKMCRTRTDVIIQKGYLEKQDNPFEFG